MLYFLVPVSTVIALLLVSQGVVQSFDGPIAVPGMDGVEQMIPSGPAASQIAIKQLRNKRRRLFREQQHASF